MRHAAVALAALLATAPAATAQTVTIRATKDATVRGGSYAGTNFGDEPILETRQSGDSTYDRRAVLTFDTETTVADNAKIASATLVLTVKGGNSEARRLAACLVPRSFDESSVTWRRRNSSSYWQNNGVDIVDGSCSEASVTASQGSKVSFDVTSQVQKVINGSLGPRYARFLVGDPGGSSRGSYKQYYSSNDPSSAVRPALIVTVGAAPSTTPPPPVSDTAPPSPSVPTPPVPAPPVSPPSDSDARTLRVLQWNTHHGGFGSDGRYDPNRLASWIVKMNPDVVMLNEVEKNTGWGNQNQPEVYKNLLEDKTGRTWYYVFAQEYGNWSSNGKGNLILSRVPFTHVDRYELMHNGDRSAAQAVISWNGRDITLVVTHLDPESHSLRLRQATEVTNWLSAEPENKILTGDMNAWPDQSSIEQLTKYFYDSWTVAESKGTAYSYSGNDGETKKGRIDYIFYSRRSSGLSVKSSQVLDTRDSRGVKPSDHRPVLTTFFVQ